jgi:large subunit ribosomal protein L6
MSRVGRKPIAIPSGVEVKTGNQQVSVKGPKGTLQWSVAPGLSVAVADGHIQVSRSSDDSKMRALHGLVRAELNNMINGVTKGYEKTLEINGVGYKAQLQGQKLALNVGYTHAVEFKLPPGIEAKIDKATIITIRGSDKRLVGQVAANLRAVKPPDVYKQKGIKYAGEILRKKEGKTGK